MHVCVFPLCIILGFGLGEENGGKDCKAWVRKWGEEYGFPSGTLLYTSSPKHGNFTQT